MIAFAKLFESVNWSVFVRLFESVFGLLRSLVMEFGYGCCFLVGTALCLLIVTVIESVIVRLSGLLFVFGFVRYFESEIVTLFVFRSAKMSESLTLRRFEIAM